MKYNFVVGQRVVFVGMGCFPMWPKGYEAPIYGHVYTIREIRPDPIYHELIGLLLKEITHPLVPNHPLGHAIEYACDISEWRPAVDRKTDISVFQKMLTDNRVNA